MQPHDLDVVSLSFGIAFASLGVSFLLSPLGVFDLPWQWVGPALILALGGLLLASAVRSLRRGQADDELDELDELAEP